MVIYKLTETEDLVRYTVILEKEADGGYVAMVPALSGCVSQGDTRDEVIVNIREAAELYIEDCVENPATRFPCGQERAIHGCLSSAPHLR